MNGGWGISYEIALRWTPLDLTDCKSTLVQVMAWCRQATRHYLSQYWPRSMSPNGVTRPQWVNSLWPSDTTWWLRSGSTLVQAMACCLMAASHYMNWCRLIISEILWYFWEGNFAWSAQGICLSLIWVRKLPIQDYKLISHGAKQLRIPVAPFTNMV